MRDALVSVGAAVAGAALVLSLAAPAGAPAGGTRLGAREDPGPLSPSCWAELLASGASDGDTLARAAATSGALGGEGGVLEALAGEERARAELAALWLNLSTERLPPWARREAGFFAAELDETLAALARGEAVGAARLAAIVDAVASWNRGEPPGGARE